MDRNNRHGSVRKKKVKAQIYPQIFIDQDADFASIKLAPGSVFALKQ